MDRRYRSRPSDAGRSHRAAIAFLVWLHLLTRHLQGLRLDVSTTPASTAVWWFVPIAHLFMPYLVVRSLLKTLGGGALVRSSAVTWWWATWIAGTSFTYVGKYAAGVVVPAPHDREGAPGPFPSRRKESWCSADGWRSR